MKKLLSLLLAVAPLTLSAATKQFVMTWDPLTPADALVKGECQINGGPFTAVGEALATGSISFDLDLNPGDTITCRAKSTKIGIPDSVNSEVAITVIPLDPPRNVNVQAVP